MAATYVHHITIKSNDVREPKYKTIVIESTDTNAEMYEKMKALTAFERAVSTGYHLSIETSYLVENKKMKKKVRNKEQFEQLITDSLKMIKKAEVELHLRKISEDF